MLLSSLSKKLSAEKGFRASGIRTNIDCTDINDVTPHGRRGRVCRRRVCMYSGNTKLIAETRHARPGNTAPSRPPFYTLAVDDILHVYNIIYIYMWMYVCVCVCVFSVIYIYILYTYNVFRLGSADTAPVAEATTILRRNAFTYLYAWYNIYCVC